MNNMISRRTFLKGGAAAVGAVAASSVPSVAGTDEAGHIATLYDLTKCTGCGECVSACRDENRNKFPNPKKPFPEMIPSRVPVEDWSDKQEEDGRLTPYNWLYIQEADVETDNGDITVYIPRRCMHCVNPPCAKLCPWGALSQQKNGLSRINANLCMGGAKCKNVCPWKIPQRQTGVGLYLDLLPSLAGNGVMYKCDRCYHRVNKGGTPACVSACPEGVQTIGPGERIIEDAYRIAKEVNGYVYGDKENGGTNTIYVSAVPFNKLSAAIEKGQGKPDLMPKKNAMARGNNIAAAMLISTFAGIVAAAGRLYFKSKKGDNDDL